MSLSTHLDPLALPTHQRLPLARGHALQVRRAPAAILVYLLGCPRPRRLGFGAHRRVRHRGTDGLSNSGMKFFHFMCLPILFMVVVNILELDFFISVTAKFLHGRSQNISLGVKSGTFLDEFIEIWDVFFFYNRVC